MPRPFEARIPVRDWEVSPVPEGPLPCLERWLTERGLSSERATFSVQSIRVFYLQYLLPTFNCDVSVGFTAHRPDYGGLDVSLHVLWPTDLDTNSITSSQQMDDLAVAFTRDVAIPLLPNPSLHLDFFAPDRLSGSFDDVLRRLSEKNGVGYLGILTADMLSAVSASR